MKMTMVPLVVGALGTPAKTLEKRLKTTEKRLKTKITELQKTVLIHTSRIIRKVIEMREILLTPYLKNKTCLLEEINVLPFSDDNNNINNNNNNDNNNNDNCNYLHHHNKKDNIKTHKTLHLSLIILKAVIIK